MTLQHVVIYDNHDLALARLDEFSEGNIDPSIIFIRPCRQGCRPWSVEKNSFIQIGLVAAAADRGVPVFKTLLTLLGTVTVFFKIFSLLFCVANVRPSLSKKILLRNRRWRTSSRWEGGLSFFFKSVNTFYS